MKYLRKFETESDYNSYRNGSNFITPNVSHIVELEHLPAGDPRKSVMFSPYVEPPFKMVDLGLPSGLLWADRNVGASSPEDAGLYFQWGDTIGYTKDQIGVDKVFNWANYWDSINGSNSNFNKYALDKLTILQPEDDAARVNMGSDWRIPTKTELQELIDNTTPTFIDLQGNEFSQSEVQSGVITKGNLKGVRFTGSNGNSIFISASGSCYASTLSGTNSACYLLSSDLYPSSSSYIWGFFFDCNGYPGVSSYDLYNGRHVRAVK